MRTYRIDNRQSVSGDTIPPQSQYQSKLTADRKSVEDLLEKYRPKDKPSRHSILMLFENFNDALTHWTKQKNAIFYQTIIDENNILHKGDYFITELIYKALKENIEEKATSLAKEYWDGKMTDKPIVEIFVKEACVGKIISDSEEQRKQELKIRHSNAFGTFKLDPRIKRVTDEE